MTSTVSGEDAITGSGDVIFSFPQKEYIITGKWTNDPNSAVFTIDGKNTLRSFAGELWTTEFDNPDVIKFVIDDVAAANYSLTTGMEVTPKAPVIKNLGVRGDSGIDLFAPFAFTLPAQSGKVVSTFIRFYLPSHLYARILPRGGDKFLVGSGVIDTGYSGILKVRLINPYSTDMEFKLHDSVGQLVPMLRPSIPGVSLREISMEDFEKLETSARKDGGRINNE